MYGSEIEETVLTTWLLVFYERVLLEYANTILGGNAASLVFVTCYIEMP